MKTVREIVEDCAEDYYPYHEFSGAYQDKNKESLDQALKAISELLVECKPEKVEIEYETIRTHTGEVFEGLTDNVGGQFYNQAIDDYEKNIKEVLK